MLHFTDNFSLILRGRKQFDICHGLRKAVLKTPLMYIQNEGPVMQLCCFVSKQKWIGREERKQRFKRELYWWQYGKECTLWSTLKFQRCSSSHVSAGDVRRVTTGVIVMKGSRGIRGHCWKNVILCHCCSNAAREATVQIVPTITPILFVQQSKD
jgi:hypothetical protein